MNRLLITIDQLNRLTDTETTLMDVVEHFHAQGWQIDLVTRLVEGTYLRRLKALQQSGNVQCFMEDEHPLAAHYDLIWICQGYMSLKMISALQKGEISGVCVFQHYYAYADQDLPYGAALENKLAAYSLAVSAISYAKLALKGIDQRKLHIFPLSVSDSFAQVQPQAMPPLSRILLISEEQNDAIGELRTLLAAKGISLDHINARRREVELTPEFLSTYQLVMAQTRPVVQALAAGVPVYLTDTVSGAGYVNGETLEAGLDAHFLADYGSAPHQSPEEWVQDIVEPYADAWQWTQDFREEAFRQWSLSAQVEAVLARLPKADRLQVTEAEAASLTLHRKVIADDAEKSRVLESWLKTRQPSEARISVLLSFINQMPETGNIGLAILDPHGDSAAVEKTLASLEAQYLQPALVEKVRDSQQLAGLFSQTQADSLLLVTAGSELMPWALLVFAEHRLRQPDAALWYCDSVTGETLLAAESLFKPDLNIDLLRSQPYIGEQMLINVAAAREAGGFDAGFTRLGGIDLAWKFIETRGAQSIGHIADALMLVPETAESWLQLPEIVAESAAVTAAHLARCNLPAVVEPGLLPGLHRVRFTHQQQPLVSIVIPTRDRLPLLRRCIESLMEKTQWPHYELLIVDNNSQDEATCDYLAQLEALNIAQLRVLRWPQAFSFSAINNFAAEQARGDLLLFLNNDTEIVEGEWLSAMVEHATRPEVGIVGARLEYHDGRIQHAGIVAGVGLGVSPVYDGVSVDNTGYMQRLQSILNVTAVSAACMMVPKEVFVELGGFSVDEFPVYLGDVDFALKARASGYLTVWTPYARLLHMGGATRVLGEEVGIASHVGPEMFDTLREKWRGQLSVDVSYNRQLTKVGGNFQLGTRQSRYQQPLPGRPLPVMMACHKNLTGCGNYRVIKPFKALEGNLILEGGLTHGLPAVMEVAEIQPDTLLLELVTDVSIPERVKQYRQVSNTKIIMEYDDYIPNLPLKSVFRKQLPKDIVRQLRRSVEQADWLVVSTVPLAEAYAPFHHDIRVAQNRLDDQWAALNSLRRQGKKPRVGWAGGSSHTGDLEILLPFMKELENEVEWVFMGMKPQNVKCEFHYGVPFEFYPEKLATLNLDLALVPLEMNFFNECKSNLRLLELGACGVPVICTDIEPYRCDLPVTRVTNRYKDWMNAIREHLADMDALAARGDALRAGVFRDWMLRDEGLTDWQNAWLPRG
ncbi:GT2 family glycosyltransferase/glycosyltransferase involved in cell wall biosynthesis [Erwinia persicina]|uniref:glycosyltransferase n=1 Tax=Erwinia persicina TaxID=55211 RepID=UPI0020A1901F|nr:glycosyltransferase [Erwinia persicina]MCP1440629.1 GT2 family glycosyltransferase/glycosyltransferase involved in cell wall biosynthesis [Erwinia persicina]